jgi:DNA-binding phage protein
MNPTAAAQLGVKPFEAADYLQSDEDCVQYLQACMDEAPRRRRPVHQSRRRHRTGARLDATKP